MKLPASFVKYSMLICLISSILLLTGFAAYIQYAKGQNTLYFQDVKGNNDFLNGLSIEGFMGDANNSRYLSISDGKLQSTYSNLPVSSIDGSPGEIFSDLYGAFGLQPSLNSNMKMTTSVIDNPQLEFDSNRSIRPDDKGIEFTVEADSADVFVNLSSNDETREYYSNKDSVRLRTGVKVYNASNSQEPIVLRAKGLANKNFTYGDASELYDMLPSEMKGGISWGKLNDTYYFTIPSGKTCRGMNNIYSIDSFEKAPPDHNKTDPEKYLYERMFDSREYGKVTPIVDIPLDGTVQVFGMGAVDNKLILLKGEGKRLVVELYDTKGKLLDRLIMPESLDANRTAYFDNYTTNIGGTASISLQTWYGMENQENSYEAGPFASILITDKCKLNYYFEDFRGDITKAVQYDGKLLLLSMGTDYLKPELWQTQYDALTVFGYTPTEDLNGKLVYEGKLITDIGDDTKKQLTGYSNQQRFRYQYQSELLFAPGYKSDKRILSSFKIMESDTDD